MADNPFTSAKAPASNILQQAIAPDIAAQQNQLLRQQQLAQLLRQQGMEPNGPTEMVSGWAVKKSPMEYLSKLGQALAGQYLDKNATDKQTELGADYAKRLMGLASGEGGSPGGEGGTNSSGVPGTAQAGGNAFGINSLLRGQSIEALGGDNAGKAYWAGLTPTEMQRNNQYLGIDAPTARNFELGKRASDSLMPVRQGNVIYNPLTKKPEFAAPDVGDNTQLSFDQNGNASAAPIPGREEIVSGMEAAKQKGRNTQSIPSPDLLTTNPDGTKQVRSIDATLNPQAPAQLRQADAAAEQKFGTPNGVLTALSQIESNHNPNAINKNKNGTVDKGRFQVNTVNPQVDGNNPEQVAQFFNGLIKKAGWDPAKGEPPREIVRKAAMMYNVGPNGNLAGPIAQAYGNKFIAAYDAAKQNGTQQQVSQSATSSAPQGVGEPFGMKASAEGNVKIANETFANLNAVNTNAPTILNALDNVSKYADKAITGAASDRRELVNSLKALIPGYDSAKSTQENTDLMKKNMSRIVAAGSNVPGATDALRTIIEQSNPNQKMNKQAIYEAVRELKSVTQMGVANQKVLQADKLANNTKGVIEKHQNFIENADPRIWQLNNMNPQDQAKYIKNLSVDEVKSLMTKRQKIKELGGL